MTHQGSIPHLQRFFLGALLLLAGLLPQSVHAMGLIIPIYGNTSAQFNAAVSAASKAPTIAIINPDDGPGGSKVGGISNQVARLKQARAQVAGYINTFYGGASLGNVFKQIDRYKKWYGANGLFLDEFSDRTGKIGYYKSIYAYAKKKGMIVVANPGTFVPSGYAAAADVIVTYEDPYSAGWESHRQAAWTRSKPASKFGAIVYATPKNNLQSVVDGAVAERHGWLYVTDRGGNDPFGSAGSYLGDVAAAVAAKNIKK